MTTTPSRLRRHTPLALAVAGIVVVSGTTGAVAAAQITGAQIKDGSVGGRDIRNGSIGFADTSPSLDQELRQVGGYKVVKKSEVVNNGDGTSLTLSCPGPRQILGMAAYWRSSPAVPQIEPTGDGTKQVRLYGVSTSTNPTDTATVVLYCGRTSPS